MVRKTKETEIKGEKQLEDLTDSVKFMSNEFHEYEKERLERLEMEARIVELVSLSTKFKKLEYTADRMKQYSRRNSMLIHGKEKKGKMQNPLLSKQLKRKWV